MTIERVEPQDMGPRDWGTETLIAHTRHYLGKILRMKSGTYGGLQYHREKEETFHLVSGSCYVRYDDNGSLRSVVMHPGETYHIPPGAVHQVIAIEDCVFFEVSTPHFDDRVRVEKDYGLPEGGGLPTTEVAHHGVFDPGQTAQ